MHRLLQVDKTYSIWGDYFDFVKALPRLLYRYMKVACNSLVLIAAGIGGLVIGGILILGGLFAGLTVCAFVNYGLCYFF